MLATGLGGSNPVTLVLTVPHQHAGLPTLILAGAIVDALLQALPHPGTDRTSRALNQHRRTVFDLMVLHDRATERELVADLASLFPAVQHPAPAPALWAAAAVELDLAAIGGMAARLRQIARTSQQAVGARRADLLTLDVGLQPEIALALLIGNRLADLTPAQDQLRRTHYAELVLQLAAIAREVIEQDPRQSVRCEQAFHTLAPFMA